MQSFLRTIFIVLFFVLPTTVVYATDAKTMLEVAPEKGLNSDLASSVSAPMKFSQQIVAGVLPEWQRLAPGYIAQSPLPVRGQAMYYNPGVMQKVIAYRQRIQQIDDCADCIGYVALLRSGDINRKIWLQVSEDTVEGPFLVTDVAARHDIPRLLRIGWGIDVDWETAKRWNLRMPMVTILEAPPAGMIINSTAAWRANLQSAALQFNEISSWTPIVPVARQQVSANSSEPTLNPKPAEGTPHQSIVMPTNFKGAVVNNILFRQGSIEIRLERQN